MLDSSRTLLPHLPLQPFICGEAKPVVVGDVAGGWSLRRREGACLPGRQPVGNARRKSTEEPGLEEQPGKINIERVELRRVVQEEALRVLTKRSSAMIGQ